MNAKEKEQNKMALLNATQIEMEFIETPCCCSKCIYYKEEQNAYHDRMTDSICTYSILCQFIINKPLSSRCKYFSLKSNV